MHNTFHKENSSRFNELPQGKPWILVSSQGAGNLPKAIKELID